MNTTPNNTSKVKDLFISELRPLARSLLASLSGRRIIIIACVLILTGYILMSGAKSTEQFFNPAIFSTRRIVLAPMLCLAGYLLIILGILRIRW